MKIKEILQLGAERIRMNPLYLKLFLSEFEKAFNFKPSCTGCNFKSNFNKLNSYINKNNLKLGIMKNYKLDRRQNSIIHTYIGDNGKAHRSYGRNMTDDFAENYLSKGTKKELELRKEFFVKIPAKKTSTKPTDLKNLSDDKLNYAQLKERYPKAVGKSKKKVLEWVLSNKETPKVETK